MGPPGDAATMVRVEFNRPARVRASIVDGHPWDSVAAGGDRRDGRVPRAMALPERLFRGAPSVRLIVITRRSRASWRYTSHVPACRRNAIVPLYRAEPAVPPEVAPARRVPRVVAAQIATT